jgi:glycosyltransferase involved in cell wall biosynthesis
MARVSVVIPTCNRGSLLGAALASALAQDYGDLEVIVIDDAGAAGSTEAVEACRDSRVRLVRHPARRGGAAARNTGIALARGEYVAFLDDDDEWRTDKLSRQMASLRGYPQASASYTGYLVVDRDSGRVLQRIVPQRRGRLHAEILKDNCIGGTSSVVVKRSCLEGVGGFDERLPSFQDYDLWIRLSRAIEFDAIEEPLLRYSVHARQVWKDLEALTRGLDVMLEKYGESAAFRRQSSVYYLSFGVRYCRNGQAALARKAFRRAVQLAPMEPKPYFYFGASLFGSAAVDALQTIKARVAGFARGSMAKSSRFKVPG